MKKIKLPSLRLIGDYDDFYYYFIRKLGYTDSRKDLLEKFGKKINQSAVSLNKDNEEALKKHIYKKLYVGRNKQLGRKWYDRAWEWHWFNYSPRVDDGFTRVKGTEYYTKNVPDGYAMVDEGKLFIREDK